jgi:chemotaxis receptor (MCP) glutamine deamidase CheD
VWRAAVYSASMQASIRDVTVPPDRFEVMTEDVVFRAELRSAIAVCIYDAVDEAGAMLHLRFIIRGAQPTDVTDTTLAAELLLLDRCVESLREAAPGARNLQVKIAGHLPEGLGADACDKVLELLVQYLRDAGASVAPADITFGTPRKLLFRPSMGWVQLR